MDIIDFIIEKVPFAYFLEYLGMNKEWSAFLGGLLSLIIIALLGKGASLLYQSWINARAARDLKPQFDKAALDKHTKFYIPTQYQNASPARQEEPGFTHQYVARSPLIKFFMKNAFVESKESERFYLVLADSGMGKTTFMLNLYLRYTSFWNFRKKYKMRLYRFSYPESLEEVKAIDRNEARNTILLLDALDEDPHIVSKDPNVSDVQAFQKRVEEIIEVTRNFCEVIMTCRTQYFPGQEQDPYEINVRKPDESGFYKLNKLYLSPFTDGEVKKYLNKKFGYLAFWNYKKKRRAQAVVKKSRLLVMRPMMLSYIDFLITDDRNYNSIFEIYDTLIEKWLLREAEKRKHSVAQAPFIDSLRKVSEQTALGIYQKWRKEQRMHLSKVEAVTIAEFNDIDLRPEEITGQSLLTCDGAGNWKFAHKSIMEFFLAKTLVEKPTFYENISFTGMDMTRTFVHEERLPSFTHIKGGEFMMGSPEDEIDRSFIKVENEETKEKHKIPTETQHTVIVSDFFLSTYAITLGQFERFITETKYQTDAEKEGGSNFWDGKEWKTKKGVNWRHDVVGTLQKDKDHPVIHVSWNDAKSYCEWLGKKWAVTVRLPREAEWEYACRAGSTSPFNTGENLTADQANYDGNYPYAEFPKGRFLNTTTPVGSYPPNAWGLYDMHGNVLEWCEDWFSPAYYEICLGQGVVTDPQGPAEAEPTVGSVRVMRGGSWLNIARYCRTAFRDYASPAYRHSISGFRPVFVP